MPEYVWYIGFAISLVFALSSSILIGRRIFKTGIEHLSSRILIVSSIINTSLCGLLFLLQAATELYRIITSTSFSLNQFIVPAVFLAIPGKIIWNYFTIQRKLVAKFHLKPDGIGAFAASVASLCKTMGIYPPTILSSHLISSPFVFGRRSGKATLAIPENWQCVNDSHQHIQLLHELAHIRNHDIGFLAWSNACLRDLRLLFMFLPALIIYCYFFSYSYTIPSISLYLACSFILFVMLRYVVRKRETLADMTAALLIKSGNVRDVISEQEIHTIKSHINSEQIVKSKLTDKIQRWLTDKALFSTKQWLWKTLLWIFNFFHASHPSNSERIKTISTQNNITQQSRLLLGDYFWAGITFGLLGVIIGLGGYWLSMFTQNPQDNTEILRFPFQMYGLAAPAVLGFWVIFLTLPYWSSFRNPRLDGKFLLSQLKSHSIALAGACLICPMILTAGVSDTNVLVLTVLCALWYIFIVFFGFAISIVSVFLWTSIRYLQSSQSANLKKGFLALVPFTIIAIGFTIMGIGLIDNSQVFQGTNLVFSTIIGAVIFLLAIEYSRFSEKDKYFILCFFRFTFLIEGKSLKWLSRIIGIAGCPALLIGFGLPVYLTIDLILAETLKNISVSSGLLFVIISSCAILIIIRIHDIRRIGELRLTKIYRLSNCLQLLSKPLSAQLCRKVNSIAATYEFGKCSHFQKKRNLTINDAYEYIHLVSNDNSQGNLISQPLSWVLKCQQSEGFGLWPESSPRLYSTYQAISILNKRDALDKCNTERHTSWIKTFQQPDGPFKGPRSRRDEWEDTFFAIQSLSILASPLLPDKAKRCENWTRTILVKRGIEDNRADIIYYCFSILDALNKLDNETLKVIIDWLSSKIEELLLANIALNYEPVHFTVMTYQMVYPHTKSLIDNESITLLTERIYAALKAELADIRT